MAAWVLMAAGLLVVLFSYGVGARFSSEGLERVQVESAERTPTDARLLSDAQRSLGAGATRHDGRQLRAWGRRMARSRSGLDPRKP